MPWSAGQTAYAMTSDGRVMHYSCLLRGSLPPSLSPSTSPTLLADPSPPAVSDLRLDTAVRAHALADPDADAVPSVATTTGTTVHPSTEEGSALWPSDEVQAPVHDVVGASVSVAQAPVRAASLLSSSSGLRPLRESDSFDGSDDVTPLDAAGAVRSPPQRVQKGASRAADVDRPSHDRVATPSRGDVGALARESSREGGSASRRQARAGGDGVGRSASARAANGSADSEGVTHKPASGRRLPRDREDAMGVPGSRTAAVDSEKAAVRSGGRSGGFDGAASASAAGRTKGVKVKANIGEF